MEDYEDEETWNDERGWEVVMPPTMIAAHTAPAQKLFVPTPVPPARQDQTTRSVSPEVQGRPHHPPWTKASAGFPTFLHPTKGRKLFANDGRPCRERGPAIDAGSSRVGSVRLGGHPATTTPTDGRQRWGTRVGQATR